MPISRKVDMRGANIVKISQTKISMDDEITLRRSLKMGQENTLTSSSKIKISYQ